MKLQKVLYALFILTLVVGVFSPTTYAHPHYKRKPWVGGGGGSMPFFVNPQLPRRVFENHHTLTPAARYVMRALRQGAPIVDKVTGLPARVYYTSQHSRVIVLFIRDNGRKVYKFVFAIKNNSIYFITNFYMSGNNVAQRAIRRAVEGDNAVQIYAPYGIIWGGP